jgi:hypothetical protein
VLSSIENTGNTPDTIVNTPHFHGPMSEYEKLQAERSEVRWLLETTVAYYLTNNLPDEGCIPRFDNLHVNSKRRESAVDILEKKYHLVNVKQGGKPDEQGTRVNPPYKTVAELLDAITGYRAMAQQTKLGAALGHLPLHERTAT